jgi:spermidine/putrescine transport system substrate-binding protein
MEKSSVSLKSHKSFSLLLTLAAFLSMLLMTGQQAISAENKKVLRLLTWTSYAKEDLMKKFEAETGIKVEATFSNNEEIISKLRATRGGDFDLAQPSVDRISSAVKSHGIYQAIDYAKVDTSQIVPSILDAAKKNTLVNGKSYAVPFTVGTTGLVVNKKFAANATDFKDLLKTEYAGKVAYKMRRPVLLAMGYSFGYDPFSLYNDSSAYQKFLNDMEQKFIEGKPITPTSCLKHFAKTRSTWRSRARESVGNSMLKIPTSIMWFPQAGPWHGWTHS